MNDKQENGTNFAVQEIEQMYRTLLEKSSDPIFAFSREGRYLYVNRAFADGVGKSIESILGKRIWDVFDREEAQKRMAALNQVFATGTEKVIEVRVPQQLGDEKYYITTITPIIDSQGKVVYVICSSKDITERKCIEMTLQESEKKYRAFFSTSKDSVFITSIDNYFVDFNDALIETLGYGSRKEMLAIRITDIYADSSERVRHTSAISEQGSTQDYPVNLCKKDGSIIHTLINSVLRRDSCGKIIGYQGTIRDITAQKLAAKALEESEAKYRLLVEHSSDLIWNMNSEGIFTYISPSWERITGYAPASLLGTSFQPLVHPDEIPLCMEYLKTTIEFKETTIDPVYRVKHADGSWHWHSARGTPVLGSEGEFISLVGVSRDITEQRQAEERQEELRRQVEQVIELLPDATFVINHKGEVIFWNKAIEKMTGCSKEQMIGLGNYEYALPFYGERRSILIDLALLSGEKYEQLTNKYDYICQEGETLFGEIYVPKTYAGKGAYLWGAASRLRDVSGNTIGAIESIRDITEKREKQKEITYLSFYDQLTGLYNRRFFEEELKRLDTERNLPLTLVMADVNGLKLTNDAFGHLLGDTLLQKAAEVIKKGFRSDDIVARIGGDEFIILLPKTTAKQTAMIIDRIKDAVSKVKLDYVTLSISFGWDTKHNIIQEMKDVYKKAEDDMYRRKLCESSSMRNQTIKAILKTLYEKNNREQPHAERVSQLCEAMGRALALSDNVINELRTVGLMHDIGRIIIDDRIINKDFSLNDSEWLEMKRHSETGYRIMSSVNEFSKLAEYVLAHHERWDGNGYPKGLKGIDIPLEARIIAVADAYDAMTSPRPYRDSLSQEAAIQEIINNSGSQFDPDIARIFVENSIYADL